MKSRKVKAVEYQEKYFDIPKDRYERINWMIDKFNLSDKKMDEIIQKKRLMDYYLSYYEFKIVLYEEPEGTPRPRFRYITKSNYMDAAIANPGYVHVYSPNAGDDFRFMKRLTEQELMLHHQFIQTPCHIQIESYFKTPSSFNVVDTFLAEAGYHECHIKPDWDNIGKKYSDMYNSNIWLDDSLVTKGSVEKFYSILPRVEIYLKYINYATNKWQYNNIINRKNYDNDYPIQYLDSKGVPVNEYGDRITDEITFGIIQ